MVLCNRKIKTFPQLSVVQSCLLDVYDIHVLKSSECVYYENFILKKCHFVHVLSRNSCNTYWCYENICVTRIKIKKFVTSSFKMCAKASHSVTDRKRNTFAEVHNSGFSGNSEHFESGSSI